ncbi:TVP38/TMEM64 family protein [Peribacillus alkalitolerans]|uniref:TVP38/TMEM64 family protein n=1 Tax=Peribacillus alkalitolerans TaxID=1550385 RepID=UPI0013D3DA96|nr:VTT domain-containing protein [Peribacillus alkalitolerans]
MDENLLMVLSFIEEQSYWAPIVFIGFHVLRQFFWIPVAIVCMAGGILFESVYGTIYSIIGLTLSNIVFYAIIDKIPFFSKKLESLKEKLFGRYGRLNVQQISILRLIPFVHYHLLSLCLKEVKKDFKSFAYYSFLTNLPLAFFYTVFGHYIKQFSLSISLLLLLCLTLLVYLVREKTKVIAWGEFFKQQVKQP